MSERSEVVWDLNRTAKDEGEGDGPNAHYTGPHKQCIVGPVLSKEHRCSMNLEEAMKG